MRRRGFTLIELIVVITIIGMLASMSMGALYLARDSARVAKTQATIAKLDDIIQARYNEMLTRRLPIRNRRIPPDAMAEFRVRIMREIMRMEMPDRESDISYPKSTIDATFQVRADTLDKSTSPPTKKWAYEEIGRTPLARRYYRAIVATGLGAENNSAECLYMIVQADPEARERFQESEIGDTDGDGFREFIDGWGRPIYFLRWAPGFRSDLQTGDAVNDHDPTDPRRIGEWVESSPDVWERPADTIAFRLVPLIYSAGPDGLYGLNQGADWTFQYDETAIDQSSIDSVWIHKSGGGEFIGQPIQDPADPQYDGQLDNITNHSLGMN